MLAQYDAKQLYYMQYSNRGEKFDLAADPQITLYNEYFGGGMNTIVFQEMREARGLAYSAWANLAIPTNAKGDYYYMAFIATQNDKMQKAIEAFDEIINNMPESEKAFSIAKEALISRLRTERTVKDGVLWSYIRMRDLGLTDGARVVCLQKSPCGDPAAYLIRGAVIALRRQDAGTILMKGVNAHGADDAVHRDSRA